MLAIFASAAILVYFVLPGILFRLFFSFFIPLRTFDRSRSLEISYSFVICLIPLVLSLLITNDSCWVKPWPIHRTFLTSLVNENILSLLGDRFWVVAQCSLAHQWHTIVLYYVLLVTGSIILGALARSYGSFAEHRRLNWLADKVLLPNVSEWHVLLTDFSLSRKDRKAGVRMVADILTSDDILYTGFVGTHALDREGHLTGIQLTRARRFDRESYREAKKAGSSPNPADFWRDIPGNNMFILARCISNLNVRRSKEVDILERSVQELLASQDLETK